MKKFMVAEKFVSINGESNRAGELACFIRFGGCNLFCKYCDTKWAIPRDGMYEQMSDKEIYEYIVNTGVKNVTLTGGEPLLQNGISSLLYLLGDDKILNVEIETSGSIAIEEFCKISNNISFTLDYKLPGSGMEEYMVIDNFNFIGKSDVVKFVVSDKNDLDRSNEIIKKYNLINRTTIYFSPSFEDIEPRDIVEYMIVNNINDVKLQLQMHKYIWEPDRKGV